MTVSLSDRQLRLINNALNEGLHGLGSDEVPPALGAPHAQMLLRTVAAILDGDNAGVTTGMTTGSVYFDNLR